MLGDAGAEDFLLALAGDGRQRVGSLFHPVEDPLNGLLGRGVGLVVLVLGEHVVHKRRGAPPAHGVEHRKGTEEVGLGPDAVDAFVIRLRDLLQDQVAVVDDFVNTPVHDLRGGVGGGDVVVARILELVGVVGERAAARVVVVIDGIQEHDLLDAVDTGHVAAAPIQVVNAADQGFRIFRRGILVETLGGQDALLTNVKVLLAGEGRHQKCSE